MEEVLGSLGRNTSTVRTLLNDKDTYFNQLNVSKKRIWEDGLLCPHDFILSEIDSKPRKSGLQVVLLLKGNAVLDIPSNNDKETTEVGRLTNHLEK